VARENTDCYGNFRDLGLCVHKIKEKRTGNRLTTEKTYGSRTTKPKLPSGSLSQVFATSKDRNANSKRFGKDIDPAAEKEKLKKLLTHKALNLSSFPLRLSLCASQSLSKQKRTVRRLRLDPLGDTGLNGSCCCKNHKVNVSTSSTHS
jgi:hypothetical protein